MKALVYQGPGRKIWEEVDDPTVVDPTDVVVRVDTTAVCGSDLRILSGHVPTVTEGRVLGHEAVGTVVATGSVVSTLGQGDRVVVPAVTSCLRCTHCRKAMPGHCKAFGRSGWIMGNLINGLQAEYARVPFAETSVHKVPDDVANKDALLLADVLPTAYELGARWVKPGDTVAVTGTGPVGLATIMTARLRGAGRVIAIGRSNSQSEKAEQCGATVFVNTSDEDLTDRIAELTDGHGVEVAIEAVGTARTFEDCTRIVGIGGTVANIGVHHAPVALRIEELWSKNLTITTGLVDTVSVPMLLRLVRDGRLRPSQLVTHEFALDHIVDAYDVVADANRYDALKTVLLN